VERDGVLAGREFAQLGNRDLDGEAAPGFEVHRDVAEAGHLASWRDRRVTHGGTPECIDHMIHTQPGFVR
jgi:hypothetical protein